MRTFFFYWPWLWSTRVWRRMAGVAAFMVAWLAFTYGYVAVETFVATNYGVRNLWGYGGWVWLSGYMLIGVFAVWWGVNSIAIAQEDCKLVSRRKAKAGTVLSRLPHA